MNQERERDKMFERKVRQLFNRKMSIEREKERERERQDLVKRLKERRGSTGTRTKMFVTLNFLSFFYLFVP